MAGKKEYDVVVAGGGPGGFSAAAAAGKEGASVLLVERYGFLGGMAAAGLVNPFMGYVLKGKKLTTSVFNELTDSLEAENALDEKGHIFDEEIMKVILDGMMADRGVKVLFHSFLTGAEVKNGRIKHISTFGKSGRLDIKGKVFVDSTGDGDLAAAAGCPFKKGREGDGLCQPMTLCFRIGGIAEPAGGCSRAGMQRELTRIFIDAKDAGEIDQPRENVLAIKTLVPGIWTFNTTRILGKDGTDTLDLSEAEIEGRRQAYELFNLFRRESPRFSNAYLAKLAPQVGVRETRRIEGRYVLAEKDILSASKFKDAIARSSYPLDIHNPVGEGTATAKVPEGDYYEVPFRSLLPLEIENLVIGSRCVSSSHEAHSSLRIMPVVSGIGEAAGLAAAKAAAEGAQPSEIDGSLLKKELFSG